MHVLIVEDERRMARHISQALTEECCSVDIAYDGEQALELAGSCEYDAIVLDLMLPKIDGMTVCRRLRAQGCAMPVLMLSARDMIEDRVGGLDAGADDYLTKPFATQELAARLRALLRRRAGLGAPVLKVGDLELNPATRVVRRGDRVLSVTLKEYALLEFLMRRPGVVHTRTMIAEHVWGFSLDSCSNVVDVYVKHLRDKIDAPGEHGPASFIQAVRGIGYVLRDTGTPAA